MLLLALMLLQSIPFSGRAASGAVPGMVGYWKLSESSGSTATDTAKGNNGTWTGTVSHATSPTPPLSATYFSNISQASTATYISAATSALPSGSAARTMCVRVETSNTSRQAIMGYGSSSNYQAFYLTSGTATAGKVYFIGFSDDVSGSTNIADGNWHFVCAVYDGNLSLKIYVDASLDTAGTLSTALNTVAGTLYFGNEYDGYPCTCGVSSGMVFPSALSAAQISLLYAKTSQ